MADYQITHIRPDGADADRRIDRLKTSVGWEAPIDEYINWIVAGSHRFWTSVGGVSAWVIVRQHQQTGRRFLTTEGDGFPPNNLLRLPHY